MTDGLAQRLVALGVATLHEAAARQAVMRELRLMVGRPFAGPAVTVAVPAGDNLGIHLALEAAQPGSVVCISSGGGGAYGVFGDLLHVSAGALGVVALVIDDGIRDIDQFAPVPAVAARGSSPHGTLKRRLRQPVGAVVALGGVLVAAGDWIVGDADGVFAIPSDDVDAVLAAADAREAKEDGLRERYRQGETSRAALDLPTDLPSSVS